MIKVPTTNLEHEALKEAMSREVELEPAHEPIIKRILSAAQQIRHGEQVESQEGKAGIGWRD